MRQIDSEFCDKLLSKKPTALDQERFSEKRSPRRELKQSFARYQRDKYGKSLSNTRRKRSERHYPKLAKNEHPKKFRNNGFTRLKSMFRGMRKQMRCNLTFKINYKLL